MNPQLNTTNHECECDLQVLAFLSERSAEAFKMRVPVVSFLVLIAVVGAAGNVLVLTVYSHKFHSCSTTVFILAMAACDLFTNVVALPMQIISIRYAYNTIQWRCRAMFAAVSLGTGAGTLLLVPVAYDRFWKVWRPTQYRTTHRKSVLVSVCTILTACAIYGPFIPIYGVLRFETGVPGIRANICWIEEAYRDTAYYIAYKVTETLVFYASLLTQIVLYSLIAVKVMQQMKIQQNKLSNRVSKLSTDVQGNKRSIKNTDVGCTSTRVSTASSSPHPLRLVPTKDDRHQTCLVEQPGFLGVPVDHDTQGDTQPRECNGQEPHLAQQSPSLSVPSYCDTQEDTQPRERNGQEPHLAAQAVSLSDLAYCDTQEDMQHREPTMSRVEEMPQDTCRDELNTAHVVSVAGGSIAVNPNLTTSKTAMRQTSSGTMSQHSLHHVLLSLPPLSWIKDVPEGNESGSNAETRYLSRRRTSISTSATNQRQSVSPGDVTVGQSQTAAVLNPSTQQNIRSDIGMMGHHKANESRNFSTWSITQRLSFKRKRSQRQSTSSHYSRRVKSKTTMMMVLLTVCYIINWLPSIIVRLAPFRLGIICFLLSFSFFLSCFFFPLFFFCLLLTISHLSECT